MGLQDREARTQGRWQFWIDRGGTFTDIVARVPGGGVWRIGFLEPMTAAILSNRRTSGAFGTAGGSPGAAGENCIERADRRVEMLGASAQANMAVGDFFVISTPGGGGYAAAGA